MKILLVSTLKRRVAKDVSASRCRIIYELGEGLAKKGHEVALLGTADSHIPGVTTIPVIEKAWIDLPAAENPFVQETGTLIAQTKQMISIQSDFDIIHNHTYPDFFPHVVEDELRVPLVSTMHALATPYLDRVLSMFHKSFFIALSHAYTKQFSKTKFFDIAYNGVNTDMYAFEEKKDDYLLWLGRLSKAKDDNGEFMDPKGIRWAIKLSEETGVKLKLAGPVEDKEFFEKDVKPHLSSTIEWVGEVSAEQRLPFETVIALMQKAKAFLMTINQVEPFGLVMTEAGSCGTPVIGFDRGSVKEVVVGGKTGFVVDPAKGVEGLAQAVSCIGEIKPQDCRKYVEEHFSLEQMVSSYEKIYKNILAEHHGKS